MSNTEKENIGDIVNFLYKFDNSWKSIRTKINKDLQENNFLIHKNIYLIEIEQGIVWGYDEKYYEVDPHSNSCKKRLLCK